MDSDFEVLNGNMRIEGCSFEKSFTFLSGHTVPIYKIDNTSAFNQLVGYAKFKNAGYGNVYYRGISNLYNNVLPAIMRGRAKGIPDDLNAICETIAKDWRLKESLKLRETKPSRDKFQIKANKHIQQFNRYTIEALLQHYVGRTRFLDVVDNHWIALWMGLHKFQMHGKGARYCACKKRQLLLGDMLEQLAKDKKLLPNEDIYVYVLLMAMPHATSVPEYGITQTEYFVEVDLRKALPSIYIRPHAQHALVIKKRVKHSDGSASYFDMSKQVVGIIKVRIDIADKWVGNGYLMTESNIFPSPSLDQGYNTLLMRTDIFKHPFEIVKYF